MPRPIHRSFRRLLPVAGLVVLLGVLLFLTFSWSSALVAANNASMNQQVERVRPISGIRDMIVQGHYVYLLTSSGITLMDVLDPTSIQHKWDWPFEERIAAFAMNGGYAYAVGRNLYVLDLTDPLHPALVQTLDDAAMPAGDIEVYDDLAFIIRMGRLYIYDLATPQLPRLITTYASHVPLGGVWSPVVVGNKLYLKEYDPYFSSDEPGHWNLLVVDISDPSRPRLDRQMVLLEDINMLIAYQGSLYITSSNVEPYLPPGSHFNRWSLADPAYPIVASSYASELGSQFYDAVFGAGHIYLTTRNDCLIFQDELVWESPHIWDCRRNWSTWEASSTQLFRAGGPAILEVLDLSDPLHPTLIGSYMHPSFLPLIHAWR